MRADCLLLVQFFWQDDRVSVSKFLFNSLNCNCLDALQLAGAAADSHA